MNVTRNEYHGAYLVPDEECMQSGSGLPCLKL